MIIRRYIRRKYHEIKDSPLFVKTGDRNINNLWTGYEYGAKGKALATIGLLGGGSIMVPMSPSIAEAKLRRQTVQYQSEVSDIESLMATRGDMTGYLAHGRTDPSLYASGDLVFALHKTRHGGYL